MTKAIVVRVEGDYVITAQGADLLSTLASQASDARDEAVSAAAAALAAAGVGEYPDTGAGLSGTTEGETFWVDLGDGTGQVYRHDPGPTATPLQKFIIDPTDSGAADIFAGGVPTTAALASSTGADMVGAAGGGTVQQAIALVTPEMTGETDPGDAIAAAIDRVAAAGGGTVQLKPGETYVVTAPIYRELPDGIELRIIATGATIDLTAFDDPTDPIIRLGGKRTATNTAFAASVARGAVTFDVASTAGIVPGKLLLITSTDLFNPTRAYYYKGEIVQVTEVTGSTVRISRPLYDGYDKATTTLHLLDMPSIAWEGGEIACNGNVTALELEYVRNPIPRHVTVHGARYTAIRVHYYFGGSADHNLIYDCWRVGTGTSYGIYTGTGQGMTVAFNKIYGARHAVANGGNEPCRDLIIQGNSGYGDTREQAVGSIDCHGNCEYVQIIDNIATGYSIAGRNVIVRPGTFTNHTNSAPAILILQEIDSDYYIIESGAGECLVAGGFGVWLASAEPNLKIGLFRVSGLKVDAQAIGLLIQPRRAEASGCSVARIELQGNSFTTRGAALGAAVINNTGAASYTIGEIVSIGNRFDGMAGYALFTATASNIGRYVSIGDTYRGNLNASYLAGISADQVILNAPNFVGNTGGAGNSRSVRYTKAGSKVRVSNPSYSGLTFRAELEAGGPAEYRETGYASDAMPVLNTAAAARSSDFIAADTAANIASIASTINTGGRKFAGRQVWDSTNNRMMRARGSAAADAWDVIDGSASVTPA